MWPMLVVVLASVLDEHLGLGETREQLDGQELVPDAGAEALDVRFCHGEPGSTYALPDLEKRHQSLSALGVSSGAVSQRMNAGAVPRSATSRSSTVTVWSASMRRRHSIASASRVDSSTTYSTFRMRSQTGSVSRNRAFRSSHAQGGRT
jgi:hypothetical protein